MSNENLQPATKKETLEIVKAGLPEFIKLLSLNAKKDSDVETMALQELEYFRQHAQYKPEFLDCIPASIIMAIKSVIKKNLTLDPDAGLVYIKTRSIKVKGPDGKDKYVKALEIQESANGLISVARQCRRILDHTRPVVKKDDTGKVIEVSFKFMVPSKDVRGRLATRWEEVIFDESDFERWKKASHNENKRYKQAHEIDDKTLNCANANYTAWKGGLDPEFARAKAVRHGLKKLGSNPNEANSKNVIMAEDIEHEIITDNATEVYNDESYFKEPEIQVNDNEPEANNIEENLDNIAL